MRRKRTLHKPGFKATAALTAIRGEMTISEMVKRFDVQPALNTQWKNQFMATAEEAFSKGDQITYEREKQILYLRTTAGRLGLENDFLKLELERTHGLRGKKK